MIHFTKEKEKWFGFPFSFYFYYRSHFKLAAISVSNDMCTTISKFFFTVRLTIKRRNKKGEAHVTITSRDVAFPNFDQTQKANNFKMVVVGKAPEFEI